MQALNEHFANLRLDSIPAPSKGVTVIKMSSFISTVAEILSENKIQSAPLIDDTITANQPWERYPGVIDMITVMHFILDKARASKDTLSGFSDFVDEMESLENATVKQIFKPSAANMVPLTPTSSLLDAILVMGYFNVRRIPIVTWSTNSDASEGIQNYITQSSVLAEIKKLSDKGLFSLAVPITDDLGTKAIISVKEDDSFLLALAKMEEHNISGIPVLDANGALVRHISASDVHYVAQYPILFEMAVRTPFVTKDFFTTLQESGEAARAPITLPPSASVHEVVELMLREHIHRVYIVDESNRLVRLISVGDLIKHLVTLPAGFYEKFVLDK